ncbi:PAS domain S-box protein [Glycocaulis sp.]
MTSELTRDIFFENHPDPMLIYEIATRRILVVNSTFKVRYGYTPEDMRTLRLDDLHPEDELARLEGNVAAVTEGLDRAGIWRHRLKSGDFIFVEITSHTLTYDGRACELVVMRDVTASVEFERERAALLKREERLRNQAEASAFHFQSLFESAPSKFLVLEPDEYRVIAISDQYLEAVMRKRSDIMGRPLFELFPGEPGDDEDQGRRVIEALLDKVKATGLPEAIPITRYAIERPADQGGGVEERWWLGVFSAMKAPDGSVSFIVCRSEDVTGLVESGGGDLAALEAELKDRPLELELVMHSRELREATFRLNEREASIRTAERLLALGQWRFNLQTQKLEWSDSTFRMYGLDPDEHEPDYDLYVSVVHPEDRPRMERQFADFLASGASSYEFWHRVVRPDGRVITVRGVAERAATPEGEVTTGFVQDITGQLETDARLNEADNLLRLAGRSARFGAWRVDLDSEVIDWSEEVADIHDLPGARQVPLEDGINFYAPESLDRIREVYARCAEHGEPFDEVLTIITAKGRRVWCRTIGEAERDASGRIVAVHGAFQDISELIAARQESEEMAERLQRTLNTLSEGFYLLDQDLRFAFVNDEAERLLRTERDDLLGRYVWDIFPKDPPEALRAAYDSAMATGTSQKLEFWFQPMQAWFRLQAHPGREGLAVYFQDITQEREARQQLYLLEAAVERANDVVIITDNEVTDDGPSIVYVNDAFERVFGYSRTEAIGRGTSILRGPETDPETLAKVFAAFRATRPLRTEIVHYTKSGEGRWMDVDTVPVVDADGRHTHWLGVLRDITERKRSEEALRIARDEAEEANRLKSEFLANMSHEIRTPLNGVLGMSQLLARTTLNARQQKMIDTVQSSGRALLGIINDILDISKIEAGLMVLEPETVELRAVCEQALSSVTAAAQKKGLALGFEMDAAVPAAVRADRRRLSQVLINLLGNAVKFTPSGSVTLTVSARERDVIRFEVADTGPGISAQQQQLIFDRFRQVDASFSRAHEGAGLGLALCREFATLMGGDVSVDSEPGKGARFHLDVPLTPAEMEKAVSAPVPGPAVAGQGTGLRVLLAEDNATNRETLIMFLQELGLSEPVCVADGRKAVDAALSGDFDVVIMDVSMPVLSGLDAMREIRAGRKKRARVPILALTAHASSQDRDQCLKAGANEYLAKPVDLEALRGALSRLTQKTAGRKTPARKG